MGKKERRREKLFHLISDGKVYSRKYLENELNTSKQTLSTDLKYLREQGNLIEDVKRGFIQAKIIEKQVYEPITGKTLIQLLLLHKVSFDISSLSSPISLEEFSSFCWTNYNLDLLCSANTFMSIQSDLLKNNESLSFNSSLKFSYPPFIHFFSEMQLYNYLDTYSLNPALEKDAMAKSIYDKFLKALDTDPFDINNSIIINGKLPYLSDELYVSLKKIIDIPFQSSGLRIKYETKNKNSSQNQDIVFKTGLIVYSMDKKIMYLLGKERINRKFINRIIDVSNILSVDIDKDLENDIFHSKEFLAIKDEMFSISVDLPSKVIVRFQNIFSVEEKIQRLLCLRPTASIEYSKSREFIFYTDVVRGLNDFSKYLRSFGSAALVIQPKNLQEQMKKTAKNIIANYEE